MVFTDWLGLALTHFPAVMFLLAVIFIIFHRLIVRKGIAEYEIVYRWMALFVVGLSLLYAFVLHLFYPEMTASAMGWSPSPFQLEVAMADLGFGLIAFLSFNANYGFRLATVIGVTCWLWGCAISHIDQMIQHQNYVIGNTGSWFLMDLLLPFILILCIIRLQTPYKAS